MDRFLHRVSMIKQAWRRWLQRRLDFFTPRRTLRLGAGLLAAFVVMVFLTARTEAQTSLPTDNITNGAFIVLNTIIFGIVQAVGEIVSLIVGMLVAVSQWNKFSTIRVVDIGWTIVKDVSNMLFIIALLVIAAGTVLRLENYRYNRLLSNLIIMAFLTNFSKFIAAFFIQGAQVLMLTFVNAYKDALFGNFVAAFGLDKVLKFSQTASTTDLSQSAVFGNLLAGLILIVIAMIITAAILVVLTVRIVALWILIILSPLAFAMQILPNTKSFANRWWSEFGKYVTQGPILAFFLWLALAIVSVQSGSGSTAQEITNGIGAQPVPTYFTSAAFDLNSIFTFLISGAFLMFGLQYATSSSGVAGKWAGRVATAGFGGAATVSGINAIRDRTIAPVQGWIRNRSAARQEGIRDRTAILEQAGARVRAAVPVGQAGRERAVATANRVEREQAQGFARSRGFGDMNEQELQTRMQNSTNSRERLAAMTELQQRGRVNLSDPNQDAAFTQIMAQNRIPSGDARKLREQILGANVGAMEEQEVRRRLAASTDQTEQTVLAKDLERRRALSADNSVDVGIIRKLRNNLRGVPQQLKEFDDGLKRSNPRMALETVYNGLADGTADGQRLIADMQQGLIDGSSLDAHTLANFHQGLVQEQLKPYGGTPTKAQQAQAEQFADSYMLRNVTDSARTKGDFDRIMNSFTSDAKRIVRNNATLDANTDSEKRNWVADTGAIEEAFTTVNATGNRELNQGLNDQYYSINSKKIAENFEGGNMSDNTIKNDVTRAKIIGLSEVDDDAILKATKSDHARKVFADAQSRYVASLDKSEAGWDNTSTTGKLNNKQRGALVLGARGGTFKDSRGQEIHSLEHAWGMTTAERFAQGPKAFEESQKMMGNFVRTEARNLTKLKFNGLKAGTQAVVVENINARSLAEINDRNPVSTVDIIKAIRAKESSIPAGAPEKDRWKNIVDKIDKNDTLTGLGA